MDLDQEYKDWLSTLKAGDKVALPTGGWGQGAMLIENISHATATQLHVGHAKYRRGDGRQMGNSAWGQRLVAPSPEILQKARHHQLVKWLDDVVYQNARNDPKLTLAQLEAMHAAYKAATPKEPA